MNIYLISDTHFGHANMYKWGLRPQDFEEKLWAGFDSLPKDCVLIHCGDISMGDDLITHDILKEYPFKKWLIRGNHDKKSISWYLENGWDAVFDEALLTVFGERILFTHVPYPKREGVSKNIHGHLHGGKSRGFPAYYDTSYHKEVTPEAIGYTPIKLSQKFL